MEAVLRQGYAHRINTGADPPQVDTSTRRRVPIGFLFAADPSGRWPDSSEKAPKLRKATDFEEKVYFRISFCRMFRSNS